MAVLTVTQVNTYIKALIEEVPHIRNVYISGEISNFKHYNSGHMYFTLKDSKSQLKCVFFAGDNYKIKFTPESGMKVICFGQIGVYERDGVYQLYVRDMQVEGVGSLQVAFEQLKDKLEKEGLFDTSYKKPIPKYPLKIGVATSNMGAAVEDIKNVLGRRFPLCEVVIAPTVVQGDSAPADIVKSLRLLDSIEGIDTIIVGRGGGSIEDLWAFNTEEVARAVFNCKTPVISAVGHETDFTICDFVADLRAPTPSAAAELAVPDIKNEINYINNLSTSLESAVTAFVENEEKRIDDIKNNSPLYNTDSFFASLIEKLDGFENKLFSEFDNRIKFEEQRLSGVARALNALSPLAVLARGYSITKNDNGVVGRVKSTKVGEKIETTLSDGKIISEVLEVYDNEG
ncbi:MAG: exodeoxyribonuclease VII large subunit [Eubacterium sp.]|nr:exodeoxyribonuclease VII large subunit [Eubacterium sp.]